MTGRVSCPKCGTGPVNKGADKLAREHNRIHHKGARVASVARA
jgi:hypothetical protein